MRVHPDSSTERRYLFREADHITLASLFLVFGVPFVGTAADMNININVPPPPPPPAQEESPPPAEQAPEARGLWNLQHRLTSWWFPAEQATFIWSRTRQAFISTGASGIVSIEASGSGPRFTTDSGRRLERFLSPRPSWPYRRLCSRNAARISSDTLR